jgi:hypothetical protein
VLNSHNIPGRIRRCNSPRLIMPERALLLNSAGFELTDESHADQSSDDFEILSHLEVERKPKSIAPPLRGAWTPTPTPTTSGSEGATPSPDKTPRSQNTKSKPKSTSQVKVEGESSASPSAKRVKRTDKSDKTGTKTVSHCTQLRQ